jgi:hypothetical protein
MYAATVIHMRWPANCALVWKVMSEVGMPGLSQTTIGRSSMERGPVT